MVPAKVREALKSCWQPGKMCTAWFKEVKTSLCHLSRTGLAQDWPLRMKVVNSPGPGECTALVVGPGSA